MGDEESSVVQFDKVLVLTGQRSAYRIHRTHSEDRNEIGIDGAAAYELLSPRFSNSSFRARPEAIH